MRRTVPSLLLIAICTTVSIAHDAPTTAQSESVARCAAQMAAAGMNFFNSLSAEQQQRAKFAFADDERLNWAFIPKPRKGIPLRDMTPAQREAAIALLKAGVSQRGFEKADAIMNDLELTLRDIEKSPSRDSGLYFVSLFGEPAPNGTWGWRFEGHHISFNFTIVDGETVAAAPNFLGANPANVPDGPHKGLRVLAIEEDLARKLVTSLPDEQKKIAIISDQAPRDITTSNSRKITPGAPAGISADKLEPDQKKMLRDLIEEYANRLRPALAEDDLQKIDAAGFGSIYFAWMGSVTPGQGHYYRIQGPTFMIEYDNTQNNANHVHSVWRDPANDFGEDLLKQHYLEHSHEHD